MSHLVTQVQPPSPSSTASTTHEHTTAVVTTHHATPSQQKRSQNTCWNRFINILCFFKKKKEDEEEEQNNTQIQMKAIPKPTYSTLSMSPLLPPLPAPSSHLKTLVLDLDETLVHSSFKPIPNADFILSLELDGTNHHVYVRKRPGVDYFLRALTGVYELVIFTASLAKYADPLLDILDTQRVITARLFRESCVQHYGNYVKDLTHLGRAMEHVLILDNSPFSYMFQPENAIPITSWFSDNNDIQLYELLPFLHQLAAVPSVLPYLEAAKLNPCYSFLGGPINVSEDMRAEIDSERRRLAVMQPHAQQHPSSHTHILSHMHAPSPRHQQANNTHDESHAHNDNNSSSPPLNNPITSVSLPLHMTPNMPLPSLPVTAASLSSSSSSSSSPSTPSSSSSSTAPSSSSSTTPRALDISNIQVWTSTASTNESSNTPSSPLPVVITAAS